MHPIIVIALVILLYPAEARGTPPHAFPASHSANGYELTLRGTAVLRYMIFIRAYEGAFYLDRDKPVQNALDDQAARKLVLRYFHAIKAPDFADATTEMIRRNVDADLFSALLPGLEQFNALYKDVRPGDYYTATYIPGAGLELSLNGEKLGIADDPGFAAAFFSIWIGKNPIDKTFRNRLLGKARP